MLAPDDDAEDVVHGPYAYTNEDKTRGRNLSISPSKRAATTNRHSRKPQKGPELSNPWTTNCEPTLVSPALEALLPSRPRLSRTAGCRPGQQRQEPMGLGL